jgi:hypothetical protein
MALGPGTITSAEDLRRRGDARAPAWEVGGWATGGRVRAAEGVLLRGRREGESGVAGCFAVWSFPFDDICKIVPLWV